MSARGPHAWKDFVANLRIEEAKMTAALCRILHGVALMIALLWALGRGFGAAFEMAYLDASAWPVLGWLALAQLLGWTLRVLAHAIHPEPR